MHGLDPRESLTVVDPERDGQCIPNSLILETIEKHGSSVALVLISAVHYLTGQLFDIPAITQAGHRVVQSPKYSL